MRSTVGSNARFVDYFERLSVISCDFHCMQQALWAKTANQWSNIREEKNLISIFLGH
jgi:hypothetical protein